MTKNLDIRKKVFPFLLAGVVLTSSGIKANGKINDNNEFTISYIDENREGYDNYSFEEAEDNNFVLFDIGYCDGPRLFSNDSKIKFCNDLDISVGVVISLVTNKSQVDSAIEFAKKIVNDYKIDYPVYLNIDNIVNNDKLTKKEKSMIINDFLEECSMSGMYVGISGTDTNLTKLRSFFNTSKYDSYVIMDKEKISYTGTYNVYKKLDGSIVSKRDLSKVIKGASLNNFDSSKLNEINNNDNNISNGNDNNNEKLFDGYLKGCDISRHQVNSNWSLLKENFDFIIVKCSQGMKCDPTFNDNANACNDYGIPMGVYIYNNYWKNNRSLEDFKKLQQDQADYAVSLLKDKKIDYPVYLDIEKNGFVPSKDLPKEYANAMLDIWYNTISKAGYLPGVYCNKSMASSLQSVTEYALADKFEVWIAGGPQYEKKLNGKYVEYEISDIKVPKYFEDGYCGATMCQPGLVVNAGSGTGAGFLDFDLCKVDYTKKNETLNVTEEKVNNSNSDDETENKNNKLLKIIAIVLGTAAVGSCLKNEGINYCERALNGVKKEDKPKQRIKR